MKKITASLYVVFFVLFIMSCDKKNDDVVDPLSNSAFPQVILLSDEGDGDLEDEDKFSFKITLADRKDPDGDELGGKIIPLEEEVTVQFAVTGFEGFVQLQDYIQDASAFYEIDDCTTSPVNLQFNKTTGIGTVVFPAGVEEVEVEFETDGSLFDDNLFNTDERSVTIKLTGITTTNKKITVNKTADFTYTVQDDEGIYGEWKLDVTNAALFQKFKDLFGLINEDIRDLQAADVDEILIAFEYGEVKAIVVLKETEVIDDCGSPSVENKVIEIEAEIEELADDALDGDVEFGETLELANGYFREFVYSGSFIIIGNQLNITLEGEFGDDTTDEITLVLDK